MRARKVQVARKTPDRPDPECSQQERTISVSPLSLETAMHCGSQYGHPQYGPEMREVSGSIWDEARFFLQ